MIKTISRTQGYHENVLDTICDNTDADKPTVGGATDLPDGSVCFNRDEQIEYLAFRGTWSVYQTLG